MRYILGKMMEDQHPKIHKEYCMHHKNKLEDCSRCKDVCPTGALQGEKADLRVKASLCKTCGGCGGVCPTQAIETVGFSGIELVKAIKVRNEVLIECRKGKQEGSIKVPCLRGLSPELLVVLFTLFQNKTFYFNLCLCSQCQLNDDALFKSNLKKAKIALEALGLNPCIDLVEEEEKLPKVSREELSRKEFFSLLKNESIFMGQKALVEFTNQLKEGPHPPLPYRGYLLEVLKGLKDLKEQVLPKEVTLLQNLMVGTNCNGCGFCGAICPRGGWKLQEGESELVLMHGIEACTSCGLCGKLCPQGAITVENFPLALLQEKENVKRKIHLVKCQDCGTSMGDTQQETPICKRCRNKAELRQVFEGFM